MGPPDSSPRCERAELIELLSRMLEPSIAADAVERAGAELGYREGAFPIEAAYEVLDSLASSPGVIGAAASVARTELRVTAIRRRLERRNER